jgi:hypothetical protein
MDQGPLLDTWPDMIDNKRGKYDLAVVGNVCIQQPCASSDEQSFSEQSFSGADPHGGISNWKSESEDQSKLWLMSEDKSIVIPNVKQEPDLITYDYMSPERFANPASIMTDQADRYFTYADQDGSVELAGTVLSTPDINVASHLQRHGEGHSVTHSSPDPNPLYRQNPTLSPGGRRFPCHLCDKQFDFMTHLQRHILVHTGEKPYKCDVCDYSCNHKGNLKTHALLHTGSRPHQCHLCLRSFTQRSHLKSHLQTHDHASN